MERVPFGTLGLGKKNAVFLALVVRDVKYNEIDLEGNFTLPVILLANRSAKDKGYIGGFVDGNETLLEALTRECIEEANLDISKLELVEICSHSFAINSHLYLAYIDSYDELKNIVKNTFNAPHYGKEIEGFQLSQIRDFKKRGKGLPKLLQSPMASSVLEELLILLVEQKLFNKKELETITNDLGLDLETLIN